MSNEPAKIYDLLILFKSGNSVRLDEVQECQWTKTALGELTRLIINQRPTATHKVLMPLLNLSQIEAVVQLDPPSEQQKNRNADT